jgi:hypothetical protein
MEERFLAVWSVGGLETTDHKFAFDANISK